MPKNTKLHTPYTDDLATPIVLPLITEINDESDNELFLSREIERKLKLLHAHYGVIDTDTQSLKKLVLCMAKEHVPGFKVVSPPKVPPKKVGAPPRWSGQEGILLYASIYKRQKNGESVLAICKDLSSNGKYTGINYDSLKQRYYEIKRRWGEIQCENMDIILEKLPQFMSDDFLENFLAAYLPNGNAVFNNSEIVRHMANALSKL